MLHEALYFGTGFVAGVTVVAVLLYIEYRITKSIAEKRNRRSHLIKTDGI